MDNIKQFVTNLTRKYKTNDPYLIAAHYQNIHILPVSLDLSVKGFYAYQSSNKLIFINNRQDRVTQRAACAHELGHAFLHPRANYYRLKRSPSALNSALCEVERQADIFAAELLLPDSVFLSYEGYSPEQIAALEQVPSELAVLKRSLLDGSI